MFAPLLSDFINMAHPLVQLAERIPWRDLERSFEKYYSRVGQPSKPVRMMIGLLILKQLHNLGDETLMPEWVRDPYFQYFCGEAHFQHRPPCDPSDLVHFRKRIGTDGVKRILQLSIDLHSEKVAASTDVLADTTVQEKNITFPTDAKLHRKIIEKCNAIASDEGVKLRQSYKRTVKKLMRQQYNGHHPRRRKQAGKARRHLKTIAGRQVRDLDRKLSADTRENYHDKFQMFNKVLNQSTTSKDKVYSLHEADVACIAKGKAHKRYEFGSKVSIAVLPGCNIVVGALSFTGNPNDSRTLNDTLHQVKEFTGKEFKRVIVDRGYRGAKVTTDTEVVLPGTGKGLSDWQRRQQRKRCRSRAAIEPVIGHLKDDFRMRRNFLKGLLGDQINVMLAAAAFNFKSWLRECGLNRFLSALRSIIATFSIIVRASTTNQHGLLASS